MRPPGAAPFEALHLITVYCDDKSHPTKRVIVERFDRANPKRDWQPVSRPVPRRKSKRDTRNPETTFQTIGDGRPVSREATVQAAEVRERWRLRCPLCGRTVEAAAAGVRFADVLSSLAWHFIGEVSLEGLGARLR